MTPQTMRRIRQFHLYLGVFFAPAIVCFALSGALQTFRLQEEKGWGSQPPAWIEWIASVHKDSKLPRIKAPEAGHEEAGPQKPVAAPAGLQKPAATAGPKPPQVNKLPMQIFTVVMSVGLILSAFLGAAIALNNRSTRRMAVAMLAAGSVVPIALLYI